MNFDFDYLLLLNNDTTVDKNFLNELIKILTIKNSAGIAGPTLYFYDDPQIQSAGAEVNWKTGHPTLLKRKEVSYSSEVKAVEFVSGCALIAKNEVFKKIGFFNATISLIGKKPIFVPEQVKQDTKYYRFQSQKYGINFHPLLTK